MVFVTFFYGPGMPVLFPITLAGLIFNYLSEKLRMAYSYQKPPMYDSSLSQNTLDSLGFAPFFYVIMATWLYSNQQVFHNVVPVIKDNYLYPLQEHTFASLFNQMTPASPFVAYILIFVLLVLLAVCSKCCGKDDGSAGVNDLVVTENLPPFFSVLKNKDREFWFREEIVARERIGMTRIRDTNFKHLVFAEHNTSKSRLRSVHNYDILTNPFYSDRFLYIPCTYPQRDDFTISKYSDPYMKVYQSDIVRLVCDLAYMPRTEAEKIEFSEKYIFKRMLEVRNLTRIKNETGDTDREEREGGKIDSAQKLVQNDREEENG